MLVFKPKLKKKSPKRMKSPKLSVTSNNHTLKQNKKRTNGRNGIIKTFQTSLRPPTMIKKTFESKLLGINKHAVQKNSLQKQ